jgi:hypothetical protein
MSDEGSGCRHRIGTDMFSLWQHRRMTPEQASTTIDLFLHDLLNTGEGTVGGSVHIHCTDTAGEWTIRESDDGFVVTREHAKGDCAIRGGAVDVLAVLVRMAPLSSVDVVGDADVAARFVAASTLL